MEKWGGGGGERTPQHRHKKNNKNGIAALDQTNAQIDLIISVVDTLTSVNVVLSLILFISN